MKTKLSIPSILSILLIGAIGVQTLISCSGGDDGGDTGNPGGTGGDSSSSLGSSSSEGSSSSAAPPQAITAVAIHVFEPATGETPDSTASLALGEEGYSVGTVQWQAGGVKFSGSKFLGSTAYTAIVTLTADEGYTFANPLASAKIGSHEAGTSNNTGGSVTLSHTFAATQEKVVTGISVKTQPSKLAYWDEDELDLAGLVVTLAHNDGTADNVAFADFGGYNIETEPEHGDELSATSHSGKRVKVEYGHLSDSTASLVVATFCGGNTQKYDPALYKCKPGINPNGIYLISPVDYGGGPYEAVLIGDRVWMARNLNAMPSVGNSWCYNDDETCGGYGRLYDWEAAMNGESSTEENPSEVRGICPEGWHLPSVMEWWYELSIDGESIRTGSVRASSYNGGSDDFGFAALPGGGYMFSTTLDAWSAVGSSSHWWTSSEHNTNVNNAYSSHLDGSINYVTIGADPKSYGKSVRCVKN
uniref:Fibrobacter succinogenes major paralogous domain-containing protein n=1 Tax=uncultured bacterium contig00048 TaxID=1181533 RepID=A0A806K246_9BACT|nr:hypothetical protein [uncultured bacterium contig00048]